MGEIDQWIEANEQEAADAYATWTAGKPAVHRWDRTVEVG
jgi:hypothetical protein